METKYRELTEEERKGTFRFTNNELKEKTVIEATSERCFEGMLADLEKVGIIVR